MSLIEQIRDNICANAEILDRKAKDLDCIGGNLHAAYVGHANAFRAQLAAIDALLAENAKQARCLSIAESALFELRGTHECRGDYYDGWASSALRKIEEIKKGTT